MSEPTGIDLERLGRAPDLEAPDLIAYDATDLLLVERAAALTSGFAGTRPGDIVVIGERHGAITLSLTLPPEDGGHGLTGVRVYQDSLLGEEALKRNAERYDAAVADRFAHHTLGRELLQGAKVVLVQLPKSLDALREIAYWVATTADPDVTLVAGGRVKHMTLAQNEVLGDYFERVQAERAARKSRLLVAVGAKDDPADPPFPRTATDPDLSFALHTYGATFGGAALDHGTRLLLRELPGVAPEAKRLIDLGCGNGSIAVTAALSRPEAKVIATDESWAGVQATQQTAQWAGVADRVSIMRTDGVEGVDDGWADLLIINPPFHAGHIVSETVAQRLIERAARVLSPGAIMLIVYNSHLGHRAVVERYIGPTEQLARDRNFTVLKAIRR